MHEIEPSENQAATFNGEMLSVSMFAELLAEPAKNRQRPKYKSIVRQHISYIRSKITQLGLTAEDLPQTPRPLGKHQKPEDFKESKKRSTISVVTILVVRIVLEDLYDKVIPYERRPLPSDLADLHITLENISTVSQKVLGRQWPHRE